MLCWDDPCPIGAAELLKLVCDKFDKPGEKSFVDNFYSLLDCTRVFLEDKQHGSRVQSAFPDRDQDAISYYYLLTSKTSKEEVFKVSRAGLILHLVVEEDYYDEIMERLEAVYQDNRSCSYTTSKFYILLFIPHADWLSMSAQSLDRIEITFSMNNSAQITRPMSDLAVSSAFITNNSMASTQLKRSYISEAAVRLHIKKITNTI